jgi:hypothetical protein
MKRFLLYVFIILLFISISKDLEVNDHDQNTEMINIHSPHQSNADFSIMHIKIEGGDTVLSIVEEINHYHIKKMDLNQIIADFQEINPTVDPYHLQPHIFYYFPVYKE